MMSSCVREGYSASRAAIVSPFASMPFGPKIRLLPYAAH